MLSHRKISVEALIGGIIGALLLYLFYEFRHHLSKGLSARKTTANCFESGINLSKTCQMLVCHMRHKSLQVHRRIFLEHLLKLKKLLLITEVKLGLCERADKHRHDGDCCPSNN